MSESECPFLDQWKTIGQVILILMSVFGIFGNIFSFVVLSMRQPPTVVGFYLKTLAVADTGVLACALIQTILQFILKTYNDFKAILELLFIVVFSELAQFVSIWVAVLLAFSRFMAFYKPFVMKARNTRKVIHNSVLATVLMAIFVQILRWSLVLEKEVMNSANETRCKYCQDFVKKSTIRIETGYYGLILFLFPATFLVIFSSALLAALRRIRNGYITCHPTLKQEYYEVSKSVIAIVAVFLVTYLPYGIYALSYINPELNDFFAHNICYGRLLDNMINVAIHLNCSVNFVIYLLCKPSFRESCKRILLQRN